MKSIRIKALGIAIAATAALVSSTGTASAYNSGDDQNYSSPEACSGSTFKFVFRYNSGNTGAYRKLGYSQGNLGVSDIYTTGGGEPLRFCAGTGNGAGQSIKNNAASATNGHPSYIGVVYYNSWWKGAYDSFGGNALPMARDLTNTYNNNASFKWV
jgi:hypothetical protein